MKLRWVPAPTLSLVRMARHFYRAGELPDATLTAAFRTPMTSIAQRLLSASVEPAEFWPALVDEVVAAEADTLLTAQRCEIALLRAGGSQLQSDQTARVIHRELERCHAAMIAKSPRLADQLRLRFAPLRQAYDAYAPGLIRSVGKRIWNGDPPKDWWPSVVEVQGVMPIAGGEADIAPSASVVWIEAVLTDVDPRVPEWLRLCFQLTRLAISAHTRSHASGDFAGATTELPWSLAIVPMLLAEAAEAGSLPPGELPIKAALPLWLPAHAPDVAVVTRWWDECGRQSRTTPIALKQLSAMIDVASQRR